MKFRTTDGVILFILGVLCISRATWGLWKDVYVNVSEADRVSGLVVFADVRQIEKTQFRGRGYSTAFIIRLDNTTQTFAIDRGSSSVEFLKSQIKLGDSIKVIYRQSSRQPNTFVFQVERRGTILASFKNYKSGQTEMIILLYFFGIILVGGVLLWYVKSQKANNREK